MRVGRIHKGELLAGLGGAVLLLSLLTPWFEPDRTGFSSLAVGDFFVAAAALIAIAVPLLSAGQQKTDLPVVAATLSVIASGIAVGFVLFRLIDPIAGGREAGLYLALAASLTAFGGSILAMDDERP